MYLLNYRETIIMIEFNCISWSGNYKLGLTICEKNYNFFIVFFSDDTFEIYNNGKTIHNVNLTTLSESEYFMYSLSIDSLPISLDNIKKLQQIAIEHWSEHKYMLTKEFTPYLQFDIEVQE